jgi:hypothetical protein
VAQQHQSTEKLTEDQVEQAQRHIRDHARPPAAADRRTSGLNLTSGTPHALVAELAAVLLVVAVQIPARAVREPVLPGCMTRQHGVRGAHRAVPGQSPPVQHDEASLVMPNRQHARGG